MKLGNSIFRKLLLSAILLIFASLLIMDFYLTRYTADRQREAAEQQLAAQARVLAGEVPSLDGGAMERWAKNAGERAQARITVIDARGTVLADSEHDPETMENHIGRPEIRQAVAGRIGTAIRHSATLDRDLCYVAYPIAHDGARLVLRLAVPLATLDTAIAAVRRRILLVSLFAAVAALVIAYYFSSRFSRRIRRLQAFAESLPEGRLSQAPLTEGGDELGMLGESLHRMAMQIGDLVDRLSLESARLEAILASMVEGVLVVDEDLRVMFCNASFARAVGAQERVAERVSLSEVVRDETLIEMIREVLQSGQPDKRRLELSAGEGRAFEAQVTRLLTPSRRGAITILHDITDIERLERVRKDFVANVSHELRTPLTAIQGYSETLLDGALEDQENNRRFLEIIRAHSIRLNNIASDLLVLSDLESGRPAPEPERVDLRSAVEAALRTVESEASVRGVKLECGALEDVEVMGYRIRLEQALVNLLDNAVKFNRPGGEVRVDAARDNGSARVVISDTGIGIPSDDLSRIFERFYRVDKARSRQVGGTGLGLSIVKHVVERMHGNITVESRLGNGSKFTLVLPAA